MNFEIDEDWTSDIHQSNTAPKTTHHYNDAMTWRYFPCCWTFGRDIHSSPLVSFYKGTAREVFVIGLNKMLNIAPRFVLGQWIQWRPGSGPDIYGTDPLQRCHNECDGFSNHQPHYCLLNRLCKAQIKENIKAPRHWPWCGEFTGNRWIPHTKGQ